MDLIHCVSSLLLLPTVVTTLPRLSAISIWVRDRVCQVVDETAAEAGARTFFGPASLSMSFNASNAAASTSASTRRSALLHEHASELRPNLHPLVFNLSKPRAPFRTRLFAINVFSKFPSDVGQFAGDFRRKCV